MAMTTGTARAATSPVFLVRTTDRVEGIRRGLATLGLPAVRGKRVVIKPNLNSAGQFPASTHMGTLGALVRQLQAAETSEIVVADRSGMGNTREVMERKGVFSMAGQLGFRAVVLEETPLEGWADERLPGGHWSRGVLFPRLLQEADLGGTADAVRPFQGDESAGQIPAVTVGQTVAEVTTRAGGGGHEASRAGVSS